VHSTGHLLIDSFVAACQADERVLAAFLTGSYARSSADAHSDLDLGLITTDDAYDELVATRAEFIGQLGEILFLEDFDLPQTVFAILANGTELELAMGRESSFAHIAAGPFQVLLDKSGVLTAAELRGNMPDSERLREALRRLIVWFWHDLSHFMTAIARRQPWWAYGQLQALRQSVLSLARLQHSFADLEIGAEAYFKVDLDLPGDTLSPFAATISSLDSAQMITAIGAIVDLYRSISPALAAAHGLDYPLALEQLMLQRLQRLT
jgi:predicted nucleotidyltransferase